MRYIITESKLEKVINLILSEQESIDPTVKGLRDIMKKAGVSISENKPNFMMNELTFLSNILKSTSTPQQRIDKINARIKSKGNPELTQEEINLINSYFEQNDDRDIERAMKRAQKDMERRNEKVIANQKKGTFSYDSNTNINRNTAAPGQICPPKSEIIGVPKTGGFTKKGL